MTALIALDWGTTALRAYRLDGDGNVTEQRALPHGIMKLPAAPSREAGFRQAFELACGDWLADDPNCPVIACGMIGSAQGWRPVPYLDAPCDIHQLAQRLTRINVDVQRHFFIVPGVQQLSALPEVMRGEETQVFGALHGDDALRAAMSRQREALIALPGTHSKWVNVTEGRIVQLRTFMTGDLYEVLCNHTILGVTMQQPAEPDWEAFSQGLDVARQQQNGNLLGTLFSVRTRMLCQQIGPLQQSDYLSGLLLGNELTTVLASLDAADRQDMTITLIGSGALCQRYLLALDLLGCRYPVHIAGGATEQGLWQIARYAGLIAPDRADSSQ